MYGYKVKQNFIDFKVETKMTRKMYRNQKVEKK